MQTTLLTDQEFLLQFEQLTLDPSHFNHIGHIRLAWLYLTQDTLETAREKIIGGIQAYASSLGATDKFHATITHALVQIIAVRMSVVSDLSWETFLAQNSDLVDDAWQVLSTYYSTEMLQSEEARLQSLSPDIKPLPEV